MQALLSLRVSTLSPKMVVTCNSAITTFTLQPTKLHFLILLLPLFFLLTPPATPLNFSFSSFNGNDVTNISTEGDAYFDTEFLRLTKSAADVAINCGVGRATYRQPFLLRENATGKLADFTAFFKFAIDSNNTNFGEGLTFFFAPNGSSLDRTIAGGSSLGLPVNTTPSSNYAGPRNQYPFVAVEFDINQTVEPISNDP